MSADRHIKHGLTLIGRKLHERRELQKQGKIAPDTGLTLQPQNPVVVRPNATRAALMSALPRILETYGIDEPDLDSLKSTLKLRREQREKERKRHQAEAQESWRRQATPLYKMGVMLQYSNSSTTHKKLQEEIIALSMDTKKKLLQDLVNGKRTRSFEGVSNERRQEGVTWLSNLINAER